MMKDGKKDFTNTPSAPVVVVFVRCGEKYLLLKRGNNVLAYKNLWSTVAGFLDDESGVTDKGKEEIHEELGIAEERIISLSLGPVYSFFDHDLGREWIRHLVIVEIDREDIRLDWEHEEYRWIEPREITMYDTTPGLAEDLAKVSANG
jgi:ADP-ribose pyrophosphatase YjhB (NUDIX family)